MKRSYYCVFDHLVVYESPQHCIFVSIADGNELLAPVRVLSERNHHDLNEMRMFRYPTKKAWEEAYSNWLAKIRKDL